MYVFLSMTSILRKMFKDPDLHLRAQLKIGTNLNTQNRTGPNLIVKRYVGVDQGL